MCIFKIQEEGKANWPKNQVMQFVFKCKLKLNTSDTKQDEICCCWGNICCNKLLFTDCGNSDDAKPPFWLLNVVIHYINPYMHELMGKA